MNRPAFNACDGKIKHPSHSAAAQHKHGLRDSGRRNASEPYLCGICKFWHVGGSNLKVKRFAGVLAKRSKRVISWDDD